MHGWLHNPCTNLYVVTKHQPANRGGSPRQRHKSKNSSCNTRCLPGSAPNYRLWYNSYQFKGIKKYSFGPYTMHRTAAAFWIDDTERVEERRPGGRGYILRGVHWTAPNQRDSHACWIRTADLVIGLIIYTWRLQAAVTDNAKDYSEQQPIVPWAP